MKKYLLIALLACPLYSAAKNIPWIQGGHVAYNIQKKYAPVVEKALEMFDADMRAVTNKKTVQKTSANIVIYQLDELSNKEFKQLTATNAPVNKVITRKDAFWIGCRQGKILVMGNNGRGTAYGILELSRQAGVSPWIWWGDVVPQKKNYLSLDDRFESFQAPSVEFRGVFINDEDWSNRVWNSERLAPHQPQGYMGPRYYRMLFELLLRLRANTVWPAMHQGTKAFFTVKGNKEVADSFDIYIGSSHCEPMLRNNVSEWDEHKKGPYNFITNRKAVETYWENRVRETAGMDAIYTLGMRGVHDGTMQGVKTQQEQLSGLQAVIDWQRGMLSKVIGKELTKVPQVFIPYKEVLQVYESGLRIPNDVMLMWCDDNYGYLTRLSDPTQQQRSGGAGVYYHLSYWGRPHDYLWLSTTQPGLLYNELAEAYTHNAKRLWIVNVHDPKVAAYQLELFMDMAWNINSLNGQTLTQHLAQWLTTQFGTEAAQELLPAMKSYYRLTAMRKPELMGWNQVELDRKKYIKGQSPIQDTELNADEFGNELERYLNDYEEAKQHVAKAERLIRPELRDAFFAAIKYPVYCAAAMATKQLQAQEARHIGRKESFHHDEEALQPAVRSMRAYQEIKTLTNYYNNEMSHGKWKGNMSAAPRDLEVFHAPALPDALTPDEMQRYAYYGPQPATLDQEDCIVRNACNWTSATTGAKPIQLLGHSLNAVCLPKGAQLYYTFHTEAMTDSALLRLALIPTQPTDKGDIRLSVSIDGRDPVIFSLKEPYRSEQWKLNVSRGQALKTLPVKLTAGQHTLCIKALDEHIIVDQWMLDRQRNRRFYLFPIKPAL